MPQCIRLTLCAAALTLATAAISSSTAEAKLPETCIDRLESKSQMLIDRVASEISRNHSYLENHHSGIQGAWQEFVRYFRGAWAAECLETYPQHKERYNAWLAEHAQPVSNAAAAKMGEVCTAYTESLITKGQKELEEYLDRGAEDQVITNARSLEGHLKRPIVVSCKATSALVRDVTENYIPDIRNRAKLARESVSFSGSVFNIDKTLSQASRAFASKGTNLEPAPGVLTGSQGMADFGRALERCSGDVAKLRSSGAADDYVLTNRQLQPPPRLPPGTTWKAPEGRASMTLKQAEVLCATHVAGLSELFAKAKTHNEKYQAQRAKAWEKANLKGAGMRKVYQANGKRWPKIENLGSKVVWTYRSYTTGALTHECKEYVFSRGGALKTRKTRLCN